MSFRTGLVRSSEQISAVVETGWCELISKFKALKPTTFDLS